MTIRFTTEGVFADTEQEKLDFYDRMHRGDPVILGHIEIWRMAQRIKPDVALEEHKGE